MQADNVWATGILYTGRIYFSDDINIFVGSAK